MPKVVKFVISQSKVRKQPFFAKIFKILLLFLRPCMQTFGNTSLSSSDLLVITMITNCKAVFFVASFRNSSTVLSF